jgi:hypothetical protein
LSLLASPFVDACGMGLDEGGKEGVTRGDVVLARSRRPRHSSLLLDEVLKETPVTDGIAILYLDTDRLQLGERSIRFVDLARWINQTFGLLRTLFT